MRKAISYMRRGPHGGSDGGFTLIELLIVIVILGILAAIVVIAVGGLTTTSAQTSCQADYKAVEVAVETYKAQVGIYPTAGQHGIPSGATDAIQTSGSPTVDGLIAGDTYDTPHVGPWLHDQPTNGTHYRIEAATDGSGNVQVYAYDGSAPIGGSFSITDCKNSAVK